MITPKGRKIVLCTIIAVFLLFLVTDTTSARRSSRHTSPTGQCTVCHGTNLQTMHQESWSTDLTDCKICHYSTRRGRLYDDYAGASFNCLSCHTPSGLPVDYHMNMDSRHVSTEAACMECHSTGIFAGTPIAPLPDLHQGIGEEGHFPLTVAYNPDVEEIDDDIFSYCLECHKNPQRIVTLPDNADCTSCHESGYNAKLNQGFHTAILEALSTAGIAFDIHTLCLNCHLE